PQPTRERPIAARGPRTWRRRPASRRPDGPHAGSLPPRTHWHYDQPSYTLLSRLLNMTEALVSINSRRRRSIFLAVIAVLLPAGRATAQGRAADYDRAESVHRRLDGLVLDAVDTAGWIGSTSRFWYRKSVTGGTTFMIADAATLQKKPAFDHAAIASSLSAAAGRTIDARSLPFNTLAFSADERSFDVAVDT